METIKRKTLLYETDVEYGDYCLNHVQGCSHGCLYPCYAYSMARRFGRAKTYADWCTPKLVENALELLEKEIPKYKETIKSVQLCFTTDPFMVGYPEVEKMSVDIIRKLNDAKIKCTALTKGVLPISLAQMSSENEYGITLVSLSEDFRKKWEPHSAPFDVRINALRQLHNAGCKTWVSVEPYPTPNIIVQDLLPILQSVSFVDKIIFGRMHYNKLISEYKAHKQFYNNLAQQTIAFCKANGIHYHIKNKTITP